VILIVIFLVNLGYLSSYGDLVKVRFMLRFVILLYNYTIFTEGDQEKNIIKC